MEKPDVAAISFIGNEEYDAKDLLDELTSGDPHPTLRVGLHVQSFDTPFGTSESFVNFSEPIPEPMTICLVGLGSLALLRKRKK